MNGYVVLIMSGRRLIYYKRFGPDELTVATRLYLFLREGELAREAELIFTNDLELPDIILAHEAELDFNPLVR